MRGFCQARTSQAGQEGHTGLYEREIVDDGRANGGIAPGASGWFRARHAPGILCGGTDDHIIGGLATES